MIRATRIAAVGIEEEGDPGAFVRRDLKKISATASQGSTFDITEGQLPDESSRHITSMHLWRPVCNLPGGIAWEKAWNIERK
ncbi:hypothetical protein E2C01_090925 [Portunus trituberculatus]|uniref:Uncharacterized protein n=1 Tax=Portunus trituberculatus TaxID=210409 RepID=A0A5B7JHW9_PORTR|nr:hypothetical protein [Portunus trituberculatus]